MSSSNKGPNVDPRLTNLTNAMYLDGNDDVVLRTGFVGNIVISGNVNVPGTITVDSTEADPVYTSTKIDEIGTSGDLTVPWMPVSIDGNANVIVTGNVVANVTSLPAITGNVTSTISGNVTVNPHSVTVSGNLSGITTLPSITGTVSVNNFPSTQNVVANVTSLPAITGTVSVSGNISGINYLPAITGNVNANVSGNVVVTSGNIIANVTSLPAITGNVTSYQGTSPWIISGNVIANVTSMPNITGNVVANIANPNGDYYIGVARGIVDSQYGELKNGYAPGMSSGAEATVWAENTLYPWSSWTTAQKLYIISTNSADTGQGLYIDGLDGNYNRINETVTTNGTTAVASTNSYLRINHVYLVTGNTNVGDITQRLASGTGTVIGHMLPGFARNKQGVYTVPAGYTAYILYGDCASYKSGSGQVSGQVDMYTRTPNTGTVPFMNQFAGIVSNGQYRNEFKVPLALPQKSDIDVRFNPSGNQTTVAVNWEMILIPNS